MGIKNQAEVLVAAEYKIMDTSRGGRDICR
jgi:hypothetical protein